MAKLAINSTMAKIDKTKLAKLQHFQPVSTIHPLSTRQVLTSRLNPVLSRSQQFSRLNFTVAQDGTDQNHEVQYSSLLVQLVYNYTRVRRYVYQYCSLGS